MKPMRFILNKLDKSPFFKNLKNQGVQSIYLKKKSGRMSKFSSENENNNSTRPSTSKSNSQTKQKPKRKGSKSRKKSKDSDKQSKMASMGRLHSHQVSKEER